MATKVVVELWNGIIENVYANTQDISVQIVEFDDNADDPDDPKQNHKKVLTFETIGLTPCDYEHTISNRYDEEEN